MLNTTDATGSRLDKDHLAILMSARAQECAFGDFTTRLIQMCLAKVGATTAADANRDGVATSEELFNCLINRFKGRPPLSSALFARGVGP